MTRAGSAFKHHVDAMLHELDDGLAAVSQLIDPETGIVAVAFQRSLGTWLVPDLVSSFRGVHPQVGFALQQVGDESVSSGLADLGVDLEITTLRPTEPAVQWHRLLAEPLRLAVPGDHPLAGRTDIDLVEVAAESFIALRPTSLLRQLSERLCRQAGFEPSVAFEGDDLPTVRGFVTAGLGVAIVPATQEGASDRDRRPPGQDSSTRRGLHQIRISDPAAMREIGLAWSAERRMLPAADLFRRHVIARSRSGGEPFQMEDA